MATKMSSSASSPPEADTSPSIPSISAIPSLTTSPAAAARRSNIQRPPSYAKNRMSTYSSTSYASQNRSRPVSHAFPIFHSSLPYALVRDFAYPPVHPLHYGPPPIDSGISTPVSEARRLSDPPVASWHDSRGHWPSSSWNPEAMYSTQQLPAMAFGDGPPYSEDEDLHSPVVTTSRHRKHKSAYTGVAGSDWQRGRSPGASNRSDPSFSAQDDRGVFVGLNGDGSATYYVKGDDDGMDDGPGGEYVTYPANDGRGQSYLSPGSYDHNGHRDSHFAASLNNRTGLDADMELQSDDEISEDDTWKDASRFSRDYQFTIVSPDEEMHGKAVALFDFAREHENELPLKEGQVILVSYRHGQGWLVAEDPKTGESGLVPEEFVRLVRDIEGGLNGLNGALMNALSSAESSAPDSVSTPTQNDNFGIPASDSSSHQPAHQSNGNSTTDENSTPTNDDQQEKPTEKEREKEREKHPPVVSMFSTSSRDLDPYPLEGHQHRKSTPPQIEHYDGSLSGTGSTSSSVRPKSISKHRTRSGSGKDIKP